MSLPSIERLRQVFSCHEGGKLVWRERPSIRSRAVIGGIAGAARKDGKRHVQLDGRMLLVHRVIWAMSVGEWPKGEIDHINGDGADNRPSNLRDVDHKTNMENRRCPERGSRSGVLGVVKQKNRFVAKVNHNRKTHYVGIYKTADEAAQAYLNAKRQLHAGCTI